MDYISPLEECSADVEIKVCTTEDVDRTIEAMKMFSSASTISDELIHEFETSVNYKYFPAIRRFNVEKTSNVTISIVSCASPAS